MNQLSSDARNLNWLVSNFVERVPGVKEATVVSSDGLLIALSDGLDRSSGDRLAAVSAGLHQHRQGRLVADRWRAGARGHRRDGPGDALRDARQRDLGARGDLGSAVRRRARRLRDGGARREVRERTDAGARLRTADRRCRDRRSGDRRRRRHGDSSTGERPAQDPQDAQDAQTRWTFHAAASYVPTCSRADARPRRSGPSSSTHRCSR